MMQPEECEQFAKRFEERQQLFLSAINGLVCETSHWQIYLDDEQVTDEGEIEILAVRNGEPSSDIDKFREYIRFVTGQGFHAEVLADSNNNFHVVSWEGFEPDWPDGIDAVLSLRWHTVHGPL